VVTLVGCSHVSGLFARHTMQPEWAGVPFARHYRRKARQFPEHDKLGASHCPCADDLFAWPDALIDDVPAINSTAIRPAGDTLPDPEMRTPGGVTMRPSVITISDE
jgi:hypothetical protein